MFLKKILTIFTAVFGVNFIQPKTFEHLPKQPNVIFIIVDDLNDWVFKEFKNIHAPNLKKLANESLLFTDAHANATLCNPSRTSFMTGILPSNLGIYEWETPSALLKKRNIKTLPENFRGSGYQTFATGKLFHSIKTQDSYYDEHHYETGRDDFELNRAVIIYKNFTEEFVLSDEQKAQWVVDFLDRDQQKPFFLNIGFEYPHLPWIVPQKFFDLHPLEDISLDHLSDIDIQDLPEKVFKINKGGLNAYHKHRGNIKEVIQAYFASISFMDEQLGKVLKKLEESKYKNNTIVVLTSDHGYHLGEKEILMKKTLWDRSTHIPLMLRIPGVQATSKDNVVSLIDLYPTFNELCSLNQVDELDGQSLVSLIKNENINREDFAITTMGYKRHSVRNKDWRYIRYEDNSEELYDLKNDPGEITNLAAAEKFADIKTMLINLLPKLNEVTVTFPIHNMVWIKQGGKHFWIDEAEVTNSQFARFVHEHRYSTEAEKLGSSKLFSQEKKSWLVVKGSNWKDNFNDLDPYDAMANLPVTQVSYLDAQSYCKSLHKRLPEEEEWEIAAGDLKIREGSKWLANVYQGDFPENNTIEDSFLDLAPIKSFAPNENNLYDMAGNVWEWVFAKDTQLGFAIIKGGSFLCHAGCKGYKAKNRQVTKVNNTSNHVGFRCAAG